MALSDKDVDETIASDWAAIREKYTPEEAELAAPEPETPADDAAPAEESIPVSREADGKFKAKDDKAPDKGKVKAKDPKATPAAAANTATEASQEAPVAATAEPSTGQQRDISRAPSTWKPAARAEYEKLPPAIKAEIH